MCFVFCFALFHFADSLKWVRLPKWYWVRSSAHSKLAVQCVAYNMLLKCFDERAGLLRITFLMSYWFKPQSCFVSIRRSCGKGQVKSVILILEAWKKKNRNHFHLAAGSCNAVTVMYFLWHTCTKIKFYSSQTEILLLRSKDEFPTEPISHTALCYYSLSDGSQRFSVSGFFLLYIM